MTKFEQKAAESARVHDVDEAFLAAVSEEINRRTDRRVEAEISYDTEWTVYEQREGQIYREERAEVLAELGISEAEFSKWESVDFGHLNELRGEEGSR